MSETIIVALISAGVSLIVSLVVTTLKNKADLIRVQKEQEHGYAKALFEKRVEYYPQLFSFLSSYSKTIRSNNQTTENLVEFKKAVDQWNSEHALFFSPSTSKFSAKFRFFLGSVLNSNAVPDFSSNDWENVRILIRYFENFLKADIGILITKPVGELEEYKESYKFVEKMIEQSEIGKKVLQAGSPNNNSFNLTRE